MSDFDYEAVMSLVGWVKVVEETLPAGYGVADYEVGIKGPWTGWKCKETGEVVGWERSASGLNGAFAVLDGKIGWKAVAERLWEVLHECYQEDARRFWDEEAESFEVNKR